MGKKTFITPDRLRHAGVKAAASVTNDVCGIVKLSGDTKVKLDCKYKGTLEEDHHAIIAYTCMCA